VLLSKSVNVSNQLALLVGVFADGFVTQVAAGTMVHEFWIIGLFLHNLCVGEREFLWEVFLVTCKGISG
jgi:hypothetical protein